MLIQVNCILFMRTIYAIAIALLILTSCQKAQVKGPVAAVKTSPLVIDYPAGVMIAGKSKVTSVEKKDVTFAEKILAPHRIPVLDANTSQMVFVKSNGDRVTISMEEMAGKYDIILFNAVNNPVPLRIADLQNAMDQIFNFNKGVKQSAIQNKFSEEDTSAVSDTIRNTFLRSLFTGMSNRDKRIIVTNADTLTQKFVAKIIPGIQWVEQRIDTRTILKINFENDLITYANTDRYFTNGITIDLQAAWLSRAPLQKLMIPFRHNAFVSYNLSMVQDMYTPTDTRIAPKLSNDRPYASYLYFGFRKTVSSPTRKLKITTELDAGYIGPYSPGSYMQTLVHKTFPTNDLPMGWETQINTDIILNYSYKVQKALVHKEKITLLAGMDAKAGTLYTNAGAGIELKAGKAEPVFGLSSGEKWPSSEYYFFVKTNFNFVAYNALLQGGLFNHNNIFTLKSSEISHVVGNAEAGFHFRYKGTGIELAQHYLSPEYKGGLWHKWGRLSVSFRL